MWTPDPWLRIVMPVIVTHTTEDPATSPAACLIWVPLVASLPVPILVSMNFRPVELV